MQYLERIKEFHKESNYNKQKFINKIRGFGFYNKTPDRNNIYVFIKKDVDFVIKIAKYCPDGLDKIPQESHPLAKHYLYPVYECNDVRIQHRVKLYKQQQAYNEIQYTIGLTEQELDFYDVGWWNVGWLNNKPVIFDCLP